MERMLTGDAIEAVQALRVGLVSRVVPEPERLPTARRLAPHLAGLAPLAVKEVALAA